MEQTANGSGTSRVDARRAQTTRTILDAAWQIATDSGLESLSLREIAARVGMQAPSLYSYYPSKAAILDAMFADGYAQLSELITSVVESLPPRPSAKQRLVALLREWIGFCQAGSARYRLMFTMAVPGWQPSDAAYAVSLASFQLMNEYLALAGITEADDVDLCTALSAGLVAQQMSNDPGGDRWSRRVDDVVDMLLQHKASRERREARHHLRTS